MKHLSRAIPLLLAGLLLGQPAMAATISWSAVLSPDNEVPPVATAPGASGLGTGMIDTVTNLLSWTVSWSGLTDDAVGAHFHGPALSNQNAGVVVNIGALSGLTSPSSGSTTITTGQTSDLLKGLWYINVHTAANPAGEIRGQVLPAVIPVPATLPLLIGALGVIGFTVSRRTNSDRARSS